MARVISAASAVFAHQHRQGRGGGAAGRGDVLAQRRGSSGERCSNSPEPATVSRASFCRQRRRQAGRHAGLRQRLGKQKDVSRSGARHRGHRIHQRFVVDPLHRAGRGQAAGRQARAAPPLRSRHRDGDAAADRGRRVRHGADQRAGTIQRAGEKVQRPPRHDRHARRSTAKPAGRAAAPPAPPLAA